MNGEKKCLKCVGLFYPDDAKVAELQSLQENGVFGRLKVDVLQP